MSENETVIKVYLTLSSINLANNLFLTAALKLGATTYPFVAFVSLYARINRPDALTVITRHSGPPSSITSASTLSGHIVNTVLPRVAPVLNRKRAEQRSREAERRLRDEQDRAYEDSQRKDYERIMKKREETKRQQAEEARLLREAEERVKQLDLKKAWKRYARRVLITAEPKAGGSAIRIGVRLPEGKLVIRRFEPTDSVTSLYAFVSSQFIPASDSPENDPEERPSQYDGDLEDYNWDWGFKLAVAFPRSAVPWAPGQHTKIGDLQALKGGANLVVELERGFDDGNSDNEDSD